MPDPLADLARLEGVPSAVAAALDSVDAVLRDRGLRLLSPDAVAASLLRGARANAELSGQGDRWLPGAVRLAAELTGLAGTLRVAPAQALARAHVLVARGEVPEDELGRVRSSALVGERLAGVTALLTGTSAASSVVLAAVVHGELASVAPFGSADDLVARAAEHMVLISGGVDPRAAIPVEAGHAAAAKAYRAALAGYAAGSLAGVRGWLLHCATALGRGAELSSLRR
nr:oxidoreductase [uncultured Friedmanniella sp.]